MATDFNLLKTEIQTDPLALGYNNHVGSGSDTGVAGLLNFKNFAVKTRVIIDYIQDYIDSNNLHVPLLNAMNNSGAPLVQKCANYYNYVFGARYTSVDVTSNTFQIVTSGLVNGGVLSSGDRTAIFNLANQFISRAEFLFGTGVVLGQADISFALRGTK